MADVVDVVDVVAMVDVVDMVDMVDMVDVVDTGQTQQIFTSCIRATFFLEGALAGLFREAVGGPDPTRSGQGRREPDRAQNPAGWGGVRTTSVAAGESG